LSKNSLPISEEYSSLAELIANFHQVRVLVAGDLTLDEFLTGQVERLSREAPVLILRHEHTSQVPGGGANAIYNLAKLGAQVKVAGLIGDDPQGQALINIFQDAGIITDGILIDPDRPTVTKTRISGHARQSVTQQIVRVDRKSDALPNQALQERLGAYIRSQLDQVDVVLCSDYGDGVLTPVVIAACLEHQQVFVDAQVDLDRYRGAHLFTPNLPEAELAVGYGITTEETLNQAGQDLLNLTQADRVVITRGDQGMSLFECHSSERQDLPAFNRTDVFDVTGAGDTVIACLTLGLCSQGTFWQSALLANVAASIVVRHFGTATTNRQEIKSVLKRMLSP
jgi:rfaE bifunctional protein kinase chain/domain